VKKRIPLVQGAFQPPENDSPFRDGRAQSRPSTSCLLAIKEDVTKTHEEKAHENARRLGDPERQAPLNQSF